MPEEPEKIGASILDALSKMGITGRLQKQEAVTRWSDIVGKTIAAETEAVRIDGDTLVVKVRKAAWRQQLVFLKGELLDKLEVEVGKDLIRDIRLI